MEISLCGSNHQSLPDPQKSMLKTTEPYNLHLKFCCRTSWREVTGSQHWKRRAFCGGRSHRNHLGERMSSQAVEPAGRRNRGSSRHIKKDRVENRDCLSCWHPKQLAVPRSIRGDYIPACSLWTWHRQTSAWRRSSAVLGWLACSPLSSCPGSLCGGSGHHQY